MALRAGNGFICTVNDTATGCSCDMDAPPSSPFNCAGLEALCKRMGQLYECGEGWWTGHCGCGFLLPKAK